MISRGRSRPDQQSAALRVALRDFQGQANVLMEMAYELRRTGQAPAGRTLYIQESEIRRRIEDKGGEINALYNLAQVEQFRGKFERSLDHFSQAIEGYDRQKAWRPRKSSLEWKRQHLCVAWG